MSIRMCGKKSPSNNCCGYRISLVHKNGGKNCCYEQQQQNDKLNTWNSTQCV